MSWIKMRADLATSPKVVRISSALNADRLRVIGALHAVWCLFDAHSEDGRLEGYTSEVIDGLIGWAGFAGAMESVGWITFGPSFSYVPRFDEHNGTSAKRRAKEAHRKRTERGQMSASDADRLRTREEKRREEVLNPPSPRKRGAVVPDGFARFWSAYPSSTRKAAKDQCLRKWAQRGLEAKAGAIVAHVEAMKASEDWRKDGGAFVPAPLVYLNQERFDAPTPEQVGAQAWDQTRSGIVKRGKELGLGEWDEAAFGVGKGEPFKAYFKRVSAAAVGQRAES